MLSGFSLNATWNRNSWGVEKIVEAQSAKGFIDLEIGDPVELDGKVREIWDIRFVQHIRTGEAYFQIMLIGSGQWIDPSLVKKI